MNKERAGEILKDFSQQLNDRKVMLPTNSEIYKDNEDLLQALDIAIDSLEREDKLIELAEQNKWHTTTPEENGWYIITYYQEYELVMRAKFEKTQMNSQTLDGVNTTLTMSQWYDTNGNELDNDRVVAWKKVEPYERKE